MSQAFELHCLDRLLDELKASNARIVLARLPTRHAYLKTAWTIPGARTFAAELDFEIAGRLDDRVSLLDCSRAETCGLREEMIVDYGHLNRQGAVQYTQWLFQEVAGPNRGS